MKINIYNVAYIHPKETIALSGQLEMIGWCELGYGSNVPFIHEGTILILKNNCK